MFYNKRSKWQFTHRLSPTEVKPRRGELKYLLPMSVTRGAHLPSHVRICGRLLLIRDGARSPEYPLTVSQHTSRGLESDH